jgi:hypothetical protein
MTQPSGTPSGAADQSEGAAASTPANSGATDLAAGTIDTFARRLVQKEDLLLRHVCGGDRATVEQALDSGEVDRERMDRWVCSGIIHAVQVGRFESGANAELETILATYPGADALLDLPNMRAKGIEECDRRLFSRPSYAAYLARTLRLPEEAVQEKLVATIVFSLEGDYLPGFCEDMLEAFPALAATVRELPEVRAAVLACIERWDERSHDEMVFLREIFQYSPETAGAGTTTAGVAAEEPVAEPIAPPQPTQADEVPAAVDGKTAAAESLDQAAAPEPLTPEVIAEMLAQGTIPLSALATQRRAELTQVEEDLVAVESELFTLSFRRYPGMPEWDNASKKKGELTERKATLRQEIGHYVIAASIWGGVIEKRMLDTGPDTPLIDAEIAVRGQLRDINSRIEAIFGRAREAHSHYILKMGDPEPEEVTRIKAEAVALFPEQHALERKVEALEFVSDQYRTKYFT